MFKRTPEYLDSLIENCDISYVPQRYIRAIRVKFKSGFVIVLTKEDFLDLQKSKEREEIYSVKVLVDLDLLKEDIVEYSDEVLNSVV